MYANAYNSHCRRYSLSVDDDDKIFENDSFENSVFEGRNLTGGHINSFTQHYDKYSFPTQKYSSQHNLSSTKFIEDDNYNKYPISEDFVETIRNEEFDRYPEESNVNENDFFDHNRYEDPYDTRSLYEFRPNDYRNIQSNYETSRQIHEYERDETYDWHSSNYKSHDFDLQKNTHESFDHNFVQSPIKSYYHQNLEDEYYLANENHRENESHQAFVPKINPPALVWENTQENTSQMNYVKDRFKLIYLTIILHGIGTQMSWHMFISTKDYFSTYKLGNELKMPDNNSVYATRFLQYISFSSQIPNLLFNWINIFLNINANYTSRIVWSILIEVIVFVLTIILAMVDSSNWPGVFFYLTIGSNILLNSANGIYHSTVYGLAAKLPFEYSGAVVIGSSISGIIMAIINLISITLTPNSRTAAIYYFITALFLLLACFDTYFALPLNKFFRYYDYNYNKALVSKRKVNVQGLEGHSSSPIPYWKIFQGCSLQCFNIFFTFMITFTVFPSMMSNIQRSYSHFFIGDYYYSAITCFLTYNIAALFGNIIAGITNFFKPKWLIIPVILRALFILFFAFCNYKPIGVERIWPVLFHWDEMYWTVGMLFGLSGGYLSALSLMYCPRTVEAEYAATAAMFGAASILSGIMGGIALSSMMPILVSSQELAFELPNWWPPFNPIP